MADFDLKKEYDVKAKQYKLPSFKELNEDFEVEKIDKESQVLLKLIRKVMIEKIINSLTFLELLLNPVNAPRIYLHGLSSFTQENKQALDKLYTDFGTLSLKSLKLDIEYKESEEASLILKIYETWKSSKSSFSKLVDLLSNPHSNGLKERRIISARNIY